MHKQDVYQGLQLLDVDQWPTDETALQTYGNTALTAVTEHFALLLQKNEVHTTALNGEWQELKMLRLRNLKTLTMLTRHEFWKCINTRFSDQFPNVLHIISILQVIPVSNAQVERSF